jgi:hypothetical protein
MTVSTQNILYDNRTIGGQTVLIGTIELKLIEIAELLLDCPTVDPNISNEIRTAFDLAVWTRDKELLQKFIARAQLAIPEGPTL